MILAWKMFAGALVLAAFAGLFALYKSSEAGRATDRANVAEAALQRESDLRRLEKAQNNAALAAIAAHDRARDKVVSGLGQLKKEITSDPQLHDPAPRSIRRALGELPKTAP